ncbi:MAG: hypothetical protein U1F07_02130 [Rubrivivax sp.]
MTTVPVAPQVPTRERGRIHDPLVADAAADALTHLRHFEPPRPS